MNSSFSDDCKIDETVLAERKSFLKLAEQDERAVAELRTSFNKIAPQLSENFYQHLLSHPASAGFLRDAELVERLKQLQTQYFEELVSGTYDVEYAEKRLRVGRVHQQIGLEPRWYLGAYNLYIQEGFPAFAASLECEVPPQLLSLLKVILLDIGLTLETYFAASTKHLRQHNKDLEQALHMYFQTEVKSRQYAKLAGHEIRGSLNAISNVLEEVVDDFAGDIPPEARDSLQAAHNRCHQVMEVVEAILADPEHAGTPQWTEAGRLLDEVRDRMSIYADGRDIELATPNHSVRVWADPVGLREVFANLVSNAVHHLDKPKGQIRVEYHLSVDTHIFSVVDDGPGIPRDQQALIFQPFYRNEDQQHRGKGLGLYFVRRIVEQHGGQVWVESVTGAGSRFSFSIPVNRLEASVADSTSVTTPNTNHCA
ncbi:MAG: hypothetical protein KDA93_18045 [Planctomycetaceae bacterium]|nr:hypothetical protein [Planctomycetaceae bacterium]